VDTSLCKQGIWQVNRAAITGRTSLIQADAATAQVLAQAEMAERQQASEVKLTVQRIGGAGAAVLPPESVQLVYMAVVANESGKPIRNVACRITPEGRAPRLAAVVGQLMEYNVASKVMDEALVLRENTDHWRLLPAGLRCGFVFPFDVEGHPKVQMEARFADDAGRGLGDRPGPAAVEAGET